MSFSSDLKNTAVSLHSQIISNLDSTASNFQDLTDEINKSLSDAQSYFDEKTENLADNIVEATNNAVDNIKNSSLYKEIIGALTAELESLFMEVPTPISLCEHYPGDPVYYVNGVFTSREHAIESGKKLACVLGRSIKVFHNVSSFHPEDTGGIPDTGTELFHGNYLGDLQECVYDRLWPLDVGTMGLEFSHLTDFLTGSTVIPVIQSNPTTRQIAHLFYHADKPISIISHSQGCIIVRNAALTASLLGKESWVKDDLAWIAAGSPLGESEMKNDLVNPAKFNSPTHKDDPVAQIFAPMANLNHLRKSAHFFDETYLSMIKREMLWSTTTRSANSLSFKQTVTEFFAPLPAPISVKNHILTQSCSDKRSSKSLKEHLWWMQCQKSNIV